MKSELSPELEELRAAVRKFAQHELEPLARQMDKTGVLPDFFIGAHAAVDAMPLITRDPRRYRSYFPAIELIAPAD